MGCARFFLATLGALVSVPLASTQVTPPCNLLHDAGCVGLSLPAFESKPIFYDFTGPNKWDEVFNAMPGTSFGKQFAQTSDGLVLSISKWGEAPTLNSTKFMMFGKVEVVMVASSCPGMVSSSTLQSWSGDEYDWEILGEGVPRDEAVQGNQFRNAIVKYNRGFMLDPAMAPNPYRKHTYTMEVTKDLATWSIDDKIVHQATAAENQDVGGLPQTPAQVVVGAWMAGDPHQPKGVRDWVGGTPDYKQTCNMFIKSLRIHDYGKNSSVCAKAYKFKDQTGNLGSVEVIPGGFDCSSGSGDITSATSAANQTASGTAGSGSGSGNALPTIEAAPTKGMVNLPTPDGSPRNMLDGSPPGMLVSYTALMLTVGLALGVVF